VAQPTSVPAFEVVLVPACALLIVPVVPARCLYFYYHCYLVRYLRFISFMVPFLAANQLLGKLTSLTGLFP